MSRKLIGAMMFASALVVGVGTLAAHADPKNGMVQHAQCDTLGALDVTIFSNGKWSAGLVVGSTTTLKPYEVHVTGVFTPTGGAPQPFTEDSVKPAPNNGRLDRCDVHLSFADATGAVEADLVVRASYSPVR